MTSPMPKCEPVPQLLVAFDMEGVLTPEIWMAVAAKTGIEALLATTRDVADYQELMAMRLGVLDEHGIGFSDLMSVVEGLDPLPGARDFLDRVRSRWPVVVLSDTFEQLSDPLFAKLGRPMVLCHRLDIAEDRVAGAEVRCRDAKLRAVEGFHGLGYRVVAVGDSFNDLTMLRAADRAVLFRPSATVREANADLPSMTGYDELFDAIAAADPTGGPN
ncbi:MAG: bifunctional phosphoserine phosphatase/homoserine phosphotransferase ThrH [Acidimicrobiales bacterium]